MKGIVNFKTISNKKKKFVKGKKPVLQINKQQPNFSNNKKKEDPVKFRKYPYSYEPFTIQDVIKKQNNVPDILKKILGEKNENTKKDNK